MAKCSTIPPSAPSTIMAISDAWSPDLDRSPSLSSDSGSSSTGTLPPISPALQSSSTFSSPTIGDSTEVGEFGTPVKAVLNRGSKTPTAAPAGEAKAPSPWSAGHRSGGGSVSFDAARATFASLETQNGRSSPILRTSPFIGNGGAPKGSDSPGSAPSPWGRPGSPVRPPSPFKREDGRASPTPTAGTFAFPRPASPSHAPASPSNRFSTSPTRLGSPGRTTARPPLPTIPSDRPVPSSSASTIGFPSSPTTSYSLSPSLPQRERARVLSSAIFSLRDRPSSPALASSPDFSSVQGLERSVVGSVRSAAGRGGMGHRRAMTLPQLGMNGLPVPAPGSMCGAGLGAGGGMDEAAKKVAGLTIEEDVPGLPGRARLSRPAETASPFAPSAVFHSSHGGLNRLGEGREPPRRSMTSNHLHLLPSQTVKAIDRQREDLVAYEYLCHLAEARQWLEANITTRSDPSVPLWGESINDFEQSLRNGYALAHLARSLGSEACQGPIYNDPVRHFRHTVNINIFFQLVDEVDLPEIFRFETVDLYDAKNLPKVIYCIHALSHLMARRGLTSKMEDLVGKVDFTDAEVGAAQKGLNDAGVRMPNFRGIGKALDKHEPAPETPEQRQERELAAALPGIVGLQAVSRGALARRRFAAMVQHQRALERQRAKELAEEAEKRRIAEEEEERRVAEVEERRRRAEEEEVRCIAAEEESRRIEEEQRRIAEEEEARQMAEEDEERRYQAAVQEAARTMVGFQAHVRGALDRSRFDGKIEQLAVHHDAFVGLQACARAALVRRDLQRTKHAVFDAEPSITGFQAMCRSALARQRLLGLIRELRSADSFVDGVQAHIRGLLARQNLATKARDLRKTEVVRSVGGLQSLARAALARRRVNTQRQALEFVAPDVVGIQAQTRGWLGREAFLAWRENVYRNEDTIVYLQSMLRGAIARKRFFDLQRHFHENMSQVVRLQAAIRSRRQGSQYRQLRMGTNVPVSTIKNFMRLLDDSEFDYRGELQVESLRKELVSAIRETQTLEDDVKDLDTKIALLVKNKITHEVARAQRAGAGGLAPLKRSSLLSAANDPFAGGALDRQTQHKLDMYQQLFWLLQTKPVYLARLFANIGRLGISEKVQKAIEATTMVVFGYAQGHREEHLFLKLLQRSVQEELAAIPDIPAFVRGNFTFVRLFVKYGQGVNQRQYLATTLGPQVKEIMQWQQLDLGTDPVAIYRSEIAKEEMRTGLPSQRPKEVEYKQALGDRATNEVFIQHLISLRQATAVFLHAICNSTNQMPFGMRYIAREVFRALRARFAGQSDEDSLRVAGHIVYYRFIQPAIVAPENASIVEGVLPPIQRQNLAEVAKLLNQITVGRLFGDDQPYLVPMNPFIVESAGQYRNWVSQLIHVEDAETHFRADEYTDAAASRQPVIYISPNDIYSTHSVLAQNLSIIAPEEDDPVHKILIDLGGAPSGSSAELSRARAEDVALTLATRLAPQEDPNAQSKHLFNQAKRRVLAILKVHHGNDLEAVLARQVTPEDEDAWHYIRQDEEMEERRRAQLERRAIIPQTDDVRNMSFAQLKMATLGDIVQLRNLGLVSRDDKYQAILNSIAKDIRNKRHRRVQRQNELQTMHSTLTSLKDKKRYLDDQIKSYHVYIDQSMAGIQKKSKKRLILPWSLQAQHQRQLEKEGKTYAYGSFKYSAQDLYDRGVLLSIDQCSPKMYSNISMTVSSNEVGVFEIKALAMGKTMASVEVKLEDLLESQFVGKQTLLIGDVAKVSLPLLLHLINRKFYA
ncbi:hypothetical protein JCM11251_001859 [Rhodosporidiobolus azoricus]